MSQAGLGARLVGIGRECVVSRVHAYLKPFKFRFS